MKDSHPQNIKCKHCDKTFANNHELETHVDLMNTPKEYLQTYRYHHSEKFCSRWNDFESNISSAFKEVCDVKDFFHVTLACDDEQIQAHKVTFSALEISSVPPAPFPLPEGLTS